MVAPRFLKLNTATKKKEEGVAVQATTGVAQADQVISTGADGFLDPSFISTGEVLVRVAFEALAAGDFINVFSDLTVAKARKADASAFNTQAIGFVKSSVLIGANATIFGEGILTGQAGLVIGDPVFLSIVAGGITQTPPSAVGEIWQQVGVAISATEVRIEIGEAITRN